MILKLKGVAAILLILSMALPLSRCSKPDLSGKDKPPEYTYYYALSDFKADPIGGLITIFVYFWPLCFFIYQRFQKRSKPWIYIPEILLSISSGLWIYTIANILRTIWIGGWIAIIVLTSFLVLSLISFWISYKLQHKLFVLLLFYILIVINCFSSFLFKKPLICADPPIDTTTRIIKPLDTVKILSRDIAAHNTILINAIQENRANNTVMLASSESSKMQARMFYSVILIAILTFLLAKYNKKQKSSKSKEQEDDKLILRSGILLLFLIPLMYFLDVHLKDLYERQRAFDIIMGNQIDTLINFNPNNSVWYEIDHKEVHNQMLEAADRNRVFRKLKEACFPDLEQIVFYFIPWITVYFMIRKYTINKPPSRSRNI